MQSRIHVLHPRWLMQWPFFKVNGLSLSLSFFFPPLSFSLSYSVLVISLTCMQPGQFVMMNATHCDDSPLTLIVNWMLMCISHSLNSLFLTLQLTK